MRHWNIGVATALICVALAAHGCGRRSKAQFESEFVHRDTSGATSTTGMVYKNKIKPERGWGGTKIFLNIKGGRVEFAFTFVGRREGKDIYRVVRSFPLGDDSVETVSVEIAYEGKQIVLFDDDVGKTLLRPRHPEAEPKGAGGPTSQLSRQQ